MQFNAAIIAVLAATGIGLASAPSACVANERLSVGTDNHQQSVDPDWQYAAAASWSNSLLQRVGIDEIMCGERAQLFLAKLTEPQI